MENLVLRAGQVAGYEYRVGTVIGAVAAAVEECASAGGDLIRIKEVVDCFGENVPAANIRMCLSKIAKDNGMNINTKLDGGVLLVKIRV